MALETATYISDLNAANPAATDGLAQADDHFRLIKGAVKATFPNVTGAINATHGALDAASTFAASITASAAEINVLDGISTGLTSTELSVLDGVTATTSQLNSSSLIGTLPVVGTLAEGSVVVGNSSSVASAVAIGASGTVLKSDGTTITWGDGTPAVPAGSVIYYAADAAPTGFLKANGAAVSRSTYSALFTAIGTTFGSGDGSSTFNVPDLRGEFMRGWDDGRGIDSSRSFGSSQADEIESHTHNMFSSADAGSINAIPNSRYAGHLYNQHSTTSVANSGSSGPTGGTETRPRNIALLACIKY